MFGVKLMKLLRASVPDSYSYRPSRCKWAAVQIQCMSKLSTKLIDRTAVAVYSV